MLFFAFGLQVLEVKANSVNSVVRIAPATSASIQWAVPQSRVGDAQTNDDAVFYLTVRTSDNNDDEILYTTGLSTTTDAGTHGLISLVGIAPGTYDIGFKGHQHLTYVLQDVEITAGTNTLNFSQTDNSAPRGAEVLLAGDVSGDGVSAATLGDDVVNSVDISILLDVLDDSDADGNQVRSNLNQDIVVNSVDLSIMLDNLDVEGAN